ncbi:MAG: EpsG family protein [Clostridia bacterium]|nr:EpsG family protein [Clostridia bacterium]
MIIYFIFLIIIILSGIISLLVAKKNKMIAKIFLVAICGLSLYFLSSLKSINVGRDTYQYYAAFVKISSESWNSLNYNGMEWGYVLINKIFSSLNASFQQFLFFVYAVVYIPICIVLYKISKNPLFSVLMFVALFLSFELSGIRQAMAMSLCSLAYYLFSSKKIVKIIFAILIVLISYFFHSSSIIVFVLFGLSYIKFQKKYLVFIIPLLIISFFISTSVFQTIYFSLYNASYMPGDYGGGGMFFAYVLIFVALAYFQKNNYVSNFINSKTETLDQRHPKLSNIGGEFSNHNNSFYNNGAIWAFMLTCFLQSFCLVNQVFPRYGFYFTLVGIMAAPEMIETFNSKILKVSLTSIAVIGLSVLFIVYAILGNQLDIVPYEFFWQV